MLVVEINRLNFEHYQIKFWTERNPVKRGASPGDRTGTPGNLRSWQGPKCVQNGPEFYIPITTGRDWVASHIILVLSDWRALCQSCRRVESESLRWDET